MEDLMSKIEGFEENINATVDKDKATEKKMTFKVKVSGEGLTTEQIAYAVYQYAKRNFYNNTHPSEATKTKANTFAKDLAEYERLASEGETTILAKDYIKLPGERKAAKPKRLVEMTFAELKVEYDLAVKAMDQPKRVLVKNLMDKMLREAQEQYAKMFAEEEK